MHPRFVEDMLAQEVEAVRGNDFLRKRIQRIELDHRRVLVTCAPPSSEASIICLDGARYDTQPMSLSVLDGESGDPLPGPRWPGSLYFGSDHPVLHRPFACLRGLQEYHLHPSHLADPWERIRFELRLPTVLGHILNKTGIK